MSFRKWLATFGVSIVVSALLSSGYGQQVLNDFECKGFAAGAAGRPWQCRNPGAGCHNRIGACLVDDLFEATFSGNGFAELAFTTCMPQAGFRCTWLGHANACMTWNAFKDPNCPGAALCVYTQEISACDQPNWGG